MRQYSFYSEGWTEFKMFGELESAKEEKKDVPVENKVEKESEIVRAVREYCEYMWSDHKKAPFYYFKASGKCD